MLRRGGEAPPRERAVEECPSCGLVAERGYREGDVVLAPGGPCGGCGAATVVSSAYALPRPRSSRWRRRGTV